MGEFKDINDSIYDRLIERLEDEGYEDIDSNKIKHDEIVELIDSRQTEYDEFEKLVKNAIEILNG
ncbi:MAG: hypothetical protein ACRCXT_24040 [Paraclostridium sp.]